MAKRRSRSITARARPPKSSTDEPLSGVTPARWWDHVPPQLEISRVNPQAVNFPISESAEMRASRAQVGFVAKFRNIVAAQERAAAQAYNPVVRERHVAFLDAPRETDAWGKDFSAGAKAHADWLANQKRENAARRSARA